MRSAGEKKNWKKRVTSSVLVLCMLFVLLLSASGTMTVSASGLVDDTVNEANLYSKYSILNYRLDYYVDTSWSWLPWKWGEAISNTVLEALYSITRVIWQVGTYISVGTGYIVQEAYKLDFVDDMADVIGKNIQTLAGLSKSGVSQNGFYPGFLMLVILAVGIYAAYTGLVKRETSKAASAILNMLVIFILTAGFIVYAPDYIKNVNDFSSDVSTGALELGTKMTMPGNEEMGDEAVDKIRNTIFSIQVYKPWLLLQFGTTDEETIGGERIEAILGVTPIGDLSEYRQEAVKGDIETYKNENMTVTKVLDRFGMVLFIFFINFVMSIFVFMMCGMMTAAQILFIVYAMFLPVSFVLSLFPTYNGMVKKAVMKVFNVIMMRAGLTLIVTVAFAISAMVYSLSGEYSFFMVGFLQIVVFANIYLKMNDILAMISLQDADSNGNRRGSLMRSFGRYVVMRKMFGKYGRRRLPDKTKQVGDGMKNKTEQKETTRKEPKQKSQKDDGWRVTYGPVENERYKMDVDSACMGGYKERRMRGGKGRYYVSKESPNVATHQKYEIVVENPKTAEKYEKMKQEEREREETKQRKKRNGEITAVSPERRKDAKGYVIQDILDPATGKTKKGIMKNMRNGSGLKRAMRKGIIFRDSNGRMRSISNSNEGILEENIVRRDLVDCYSGEISKDNYMKPDEKIRKYRGAAERTRQAVKDKNADVQNKKTVDVQNAGTKEQLERNSVEKLRQEAADRERAERNLADDAATVKVSEEYWDMFLKEAPQERRNQNADL